MRFAWIKAHQQEFDLTVLCAVLQVSRQGYYAWRRRPPASRQVRQATLQTGIRRHFAESEGTYGSPRIHADLEARNLVCCVNTVAKLMAQMGLRAVAPRRYIPQTTDSHHGFPVGANLPAQDFTTTGPNQKWVCDLTYIPTGEGWLYLAAVMDLYSRKIVGWAAGPTLAKERCLAALHQALQTRQPGPGVLHHSDRGRQYASTEYQNQLALSGLTCSMSRVGNCYDNAVMESFWSNLKREHVYRHKFATRAAAQSSVFRWIAGWYNRRRRHSAIGLVSPDNFEAGHN